MLRPDNLLACGRLVLVHQVALVIDNFRDGHRRHFQSVVRENREGAGHFQQRHLAAAQRQGQAVIVARERADAQTLRQADQAFLLRGRRIIVNAHILQGFDRRDVVGICQRRAYRYRPVIPSVIVHRRIFRARIGSQAGGRKFAGHVPQQRGRRPALFKGGKIGERLDRRAGLPRADGHVDLPGDGFIIKVRRTDHRQDLTGVGPHGNQRAVVHIPVCQSQHLLFDDLLGLLL